MSSYSHEIYKSRCFQIVVAKGKETLLKESRCNGKVEYWHFEADDSYSPGSSSITCKKCNHEYTFEEWGKRK